MISRLCEWPDADDEVARRSMMLLFAGHETTVAQIGLGAALLLADHDRWRALADDPGLVDGAVEEVLRAAPAGATTGVPRYARTAFELGGAAVKAGDLVPLDTDAANHDPATFERPGTFDATRRGPGHLSFGHGARYCIGAPLARIELRTAFSQLIQKFPDMRLAVPVERLRPRTGQLTGGLVELPVTW